MKSHPVSTPQSGPVEAELSPPDPVQVKGDESAKRTLPSVGDDFPGAKKRRRIEGQAEDGSANQLRNASPSNSAEREAQEAAKAASEFADLNKVFEHLEESLGRHLFEILVKEGAESEAWGRKIDVVLDNVNRMSDTRKFPFLKNSTLLSDAAMKKLPMGKREAVYDEFLKISKNLPESYLAVELNKDLACASRALPANLLGPKLSALFRNQDGWSVKHARDLMASILYGFKIKTGAPAHDSNLPAELFDTFLAYAQDREVTDLHMLLKLLANHMCVPELDAVRTAQKEQIVALSERLTPSEQQDIARRMHYVDDRRSTMAMYRR